MKWLQTYLLKIKSTLLNQLKQGTSPHKIAQSMSFGFVLGTIPILGATTALCGIFGIIFKLNHVIVQMINYIVYPLQLILVIPFIRMGEWIFHQAPVPIYLPELIEQFKLNFWQSMERYLYTGLMGVCAWLLISPVLYAFVYWGTYYLVKRIKIKE